MTDPLLRVAAPNADAYRKHTISKCTAIAMLVTTLVAAALAIYFGYQAWHTGVDLGSISRLMSSIPFDVTFLIGCSAAVIGIGATVYSIYQYYQSRGVWRPEHNSDEDLPYLHGVRIPFPPGYDPQTPPQNGMNFQKYCELVDSLNNAIGRQSLAEPDSEFKVDQNIIAQLASHYEWMLHVLPVLSKKIVMLATQVIYEKDAEGFITSTVGLVESWKSKVEKNELTLDERQDLHSLQVNLREIYYTLKQLKNLTLTRAMHEKLLEQKINLAMPVSQELLQADTPLRELWLIKELQDLYLLVAKNAVQRDVEAYIDRWIALRTGYLESKVWNLSNLKTCILKIIQNLESEGRLSQLLLIEKLREGGQALSEEINKKFQY